MGGGGAGSPGGGTVSWVRAVGSSTGCEGRLWGEPGGCKRDVTAGSNYAAKRELE